MGARIDLTGKRFGKLVAIEPKGYQYPGNALWHCECDCGNIITTTSAKLRHGNIKSCGCLRPNNPCKPKNREI